MTFSRESIWTDHVDLAEVGVDIVEEGLAFKGRIIYSDSRGILYDAPMDALLRFMLSLRHETLL